MPADALSPDMIDALRAVANQAADAARAPCLRYFRADGLAAENKLAEGFDPVTAADRASERAIREVIEARRPADAILGEEEAARAGESGLRWVIDPIDGTRAFICGATSWAVLIAVGDARGPAVGVIDQPYAAERFEGVSLGARRETRLITRDGSRILRTRACAALSDAVLVTTFPEIGTEAERIAFDRVRDRARLTRYGLDCMGYALLAAGCVDLVIEAGLQPYDVQALIPVVEGAGGVITDWDGAPCPEGGRVIAAGDPRMHEAALAMLAG